MRERWESDREVMSKKNTWVLHIWERTNKHEQTKKSGRINEKTRIVHNSQKSDARRYKIAKLGGKKRMEMNT